MKAIENLYCASHEIAGIHLKIFVSHKGVRKIFMNKPNETIDTANSINLQYDDPYMFNVFIELMEYFNLDRINFDVPLDLVGTDFQKNVWHELRKIPYGEMASYKTIAERLGDVKLVRAVGRANGANPIPIIIPCHRIINSNGELGGYSGGLKIKEKLLELEGSMSLELF